ncbi:DNA mismatch endonuclease Vsr [Hyphobacterium sp. HN65]|uniref:Very short patch repair endonuclease n=1 Tax=Hyphobacterium lacteum TaxID=3116575 RepID=A0ABU7LRF6_9PROT|nr:DNA mismatch endonuclease Vsr [Hyphobacterium sp. HN65]MEE2526496.1 DNA mismatch endonuclease Vsr [Hyphobacterium sp. HN65]
MADIVNKETRSKMMAGIGHKDTKPELVLRRGLHAKGYRFRLHDKCLPGKPDIVLPKYKSAIFVHGCFWHRHPGCKFATTPRTRAEFWAKKFDENVARDLRNSEALAELGWRVHVVWECELKALALEETLKAVSNWISKEGT